MILFKPRHAALILSGQKTQTRRLGRKRWNVGASHQAKHNYRKSGFFALLRILDVYRERLGDISEEDARSEGYESKEAYLRAFREINRIEDDSAWEAVLQAPIWVVKFEVAHDGN